MKHDALDFYSMENTKSKCNKMYNAPVIEGIRDGMYEIRVNTHVVPKEQWPSIFQFVDNFNSFVDKWNMRE